MPLDRKFRQDSITATDCTVPQRIRGVLSLLEEPEIGPNIDMHGKPWRKHNETLELGSQMLLLASSRRDAAEEAAQETDKT